MPEESAEEVTSAIERENFYGGTATPKQPTVKKLLENQQLYLEARDKEIKIAIQGVTNEIQHINHRLDLQDLNGAAQFLREFGYFLRDNPEFFQHVQRDQAYDANKAITKDFLVALFRLRFFGPKLRIFATLLGGALIFGLGNALIGWAEHTQFFVELGRGFH